MTQMLEKNRIDTADKIYQTVEKTMINLYSRYLDEHRFEDIKDYGDVIKKNLPEEATFLKMNKRPFGFNYTLPATDKNAVTEYKILIKSGSYEWKRIK